MAFIMFYEFLIGICDVYVAGKFGKNAQAAYGFAFQLYFIFIIIGIALSVGSVSVISRLFTSENKDKFNTAVDTSIVVAAVSGVIFSAAGVLFSKNLINLLNLPQEIKVMAVPFMMIYALAFLFDYILMNTNGILRACNMVKKSLWIMTIVCVMNIILNFTLALKTPLGFNGIALATVISLFTGAALSLISMKRLVRGFNFSFAVAKNVLQISWPSGLLQAFWQLASLVLFLILSLLPAHNVEIMAALTNGLKIESAIFLPVFAFSLANAVIVGNLLGKKEEASALRSGVVTALMGVAVAAIMTLIIMFNAGRIAQLLSNNPLVVSESMKYIYIALLSEPIMAWGI
ncbi:MAG: MATE family efflux transporter, partial [Candidatus Omnitrophica bacterium]|nr:MATE family efflux transporter [Candidatus Omnitrophota bacterium]